MTAIALLIGASSTCQNGNAQHDGKGHRITGTVRVQCQTRFCQEVVKQHYTDHRTDYAAGITAGQNGRHHNADQIYGNDIGIRNDMDFQIRHQIGQPFGKKAPEIVDISNQSSKEGTRIVLELKKGPTMYSLERSFRRPLKIC